MSWRRPGVITNVPEAGTPPAGGVVGGIPPDGGAGTGWQYGGYGYGYGYDGGGVPAPGCPPVAGGVVGGSGVGVVPPTAIAIF
ncbi:hypothetical protein BCR33DRAFT_2581 [Rhizoclosmatium globosum]|uniref:Uncharacterized protein n=1 Tax=Rhizoclosmatium globosum TaxID=329046 RepID=A0A1Y2D2N0_9FUNG|nr:hypothetical protein BCR33DRAFT_2581 [Rhizoclosmatium globosum]|eukprot:ORY53548.1 hypothetical protein BCR33DRAFT_2581 [Rhizoclosmatium globosum]